jgi:hypothetical protein
MEFQWVAPTNAADLPSPFCNRWQYSAWCYIKNKLSCNLLSTLAESRLAVSSPRRDKITPKHETKLIDLIKLYCLHITQMCWYMHVFNKPDIVHS